MIRVLIVDDHAVVRQGFEMFLKGWENLTLIGQASNGQEAIEQFQKLKPDVILMDVVMPVMTGIEALRHIKKDATDTKVIILTSFTDERAQIRAALAAGANGFLYKDVSADDLAQAIELVHKGHLVLTPAARQSLLQPDEPKPDFQLSEREYDVLKLLTEGLSNPEIGATLSISPATAKFHVSNILTKLNAANRTEAVTIAQKYHLV